MYSSVENKCSLFFLSPFSRMILISKSPQNLKGESCLTIWKFGGGCLVLFFNWGRELSCFQRFRCWLWGFCLVFCLCFGLVDLGFFPSSSAIQLPFSCCHSLLQLLVVCAHTYRRQCYTLIFWTVHVVSRKLMVQKSAVNNIPSDKILCCKIHVFSIWLHSCKAVLFCSFCDLK